MLSLPNKLDWLAIIDVAYLLLLHLEMWFGEKIYKTRTTGVGVLILHLY